MLCVMRWMLRTVAGRGRTLGRMPMSSALDESQPNTDPVWPYAKAVALSPANALSTIGLPIFEYT